MTHYLLPALLLGSLGMSCAQSAACAGEQFSGIYPHLAYFNSSGECGTGAVVPWADRLWVITYAPHAPRGSDDKLYEITPELELIIRPESIGGTPANRMIHRESEQLFIGPYAIDAERNVRAIPYSRMLGRPTANARHLTDPAGKIYYATMEEGFYEVDVDSLEVTTLYHDTHTSGEPKAKLPGYHGKGLYSGQGRLIYANNGEHGGRAKRDPFVPSGALAEWDGSNWTVVLRRQFTEVTGPGGIHGNQSPETDPVWSIGWDARSLILMLLDGGQWHRFRLPKASHSYDGAHGWNTEWPRIREIGERDLLMTMHGMFWRFPRTFTADNTSGIAPRSTYLKVIGDFCRWGDHVVLGCDDTARSEFLNKRKAKGTIAAPQSQSNLWFIEPERLDRLGPVIGRGAVWLNDPVEANAPSDPMLLSGFRRRAVHLVTDRPTQLTLEVDAKGNGQWQQLAVLPVDGYRWHELEVAGNPVWVRVRSSESLAKATAWFQMSGDDQRDNQAAPPKFAGLAKAGDNDVTGGHVTGGDVTGGDVTGGHVTGGHIIGGLIRAQANNKRTLEFAAENADGKVGYYILDGAMNLSPGDDGREWAKMQERAGIPSRRGVLETDAASVIYTDENGRRYRLPRDPRFDEPGPLGFGRLCREVATERDLLNCHGTFYELPAKNAGGFARIRPVATHGLRIRDYCSYRGLLVMSGVALELAGENRHVIRSADGEAALWVGAVDDLWALGKPVGRGGPWLNTDVEAGRPSDPYLMTGFDRKTLSLRSAAPATITAEIDITGRGDWHAYRAFDLEAGENVEFAFPRAFDAYWIRFTSDTDTTASAQLIYR